MCEKWKLPCEECGEKDLEYKTLRTHYDTLFGDLKRVKEAYDKLQICEKHLWEKMSKMRKRFTC